MSNGAQLNFYGMGQIANDPQARKVGQRMRATVELTAYPPEPIGNWKRAPMRVDLQLRDNEPVPTKGQVLIFNSGVYGIDEREQDGQTKRYHNALCFSWRILEVQAAGTMGPAPDLSGSASTTEAPGVQPTPGAASAPPPEPPGDEKVDVPF
ncbi:MAG: hypothetical protein GTO63_34285 [Anaerolineae bacterium]|nr:hypothetical protein [Anaerolineae bacterium]NIN99709.1 hypothetical protein [Anaerolineae bacterium]NIQ82561.1 hypothetical protein [Anaerolineae bacterium]